MAKPLTLFEIKGRVSALIGDLERLGSYVHIPRADRDYAISVGLRMLTLRHLAIETDDTYRANPKELVLLQYYANAIVHLFKDSEADIGDDALSPSPLRRDGIVNS